MNNEPLVTCITPTYGRFKFLKEMYWTWKRQDYINKELLILNDQPDMQIICDDENVRIINVPERMVGLGAKRNMLFENIKSETKYIMPFDDDDLFLPKHISSLVQGLEDNPTYHRSKNIDHFIVKDNNYHGVMHGNYPFFGASCFNAEKVKDIKFNETFNMGEDTRWMDSNGITTFVVKHWPTFMYRQGMNIVHASGHKIKSDDPIQQKMIYDKIGDSVFIRESIKKVKLVEEITPQSKTLYDQLLRWKPE